MSKTKTEQTPKPGKHHAPVLALPAAIPPMLSRLQVCALVQLSYVAIWRMIRAGTFPAAINVAPQGGECNLWDRDEILEWWNEKKRSGKRQPCAGKDADKAQGVAP